MNDQAVGSVVTDKRQRVLDGATHAFLNYGFERTTMDDIARAAEMSRPALYLLFRNKADIYRAIAESLFEEAVTGAAAALAGDRPLRERLAAMLEAGILGMVARIEDTPHGAEIMDMKSLVADSIDGWQSRLRGMVAAELAAEAAQRRVDLAAVGQSAESLADLFWDALEGMKARGVNAAGKREASRGLIALVSSVVGA